MLKTGLVFQVETPDFGKKKIKQSGDFHMDRLSNLYSFLVDRGNMSQDSVLKKKSFNFSVRTVRLCKYLGEQHRGYILSQQLLRSGTAIGALLREAEFAESRKDFVHKLSIALKEANETEYLLQLIYATDYINKQMYDSIHKDIIELISMLVSSIKTIKSKEGFSN